MGKVKATFIGLDAAIERQSARFLVCLVPPDGNATTALVEAMRQGNQFWVTGPTLMPYRVPIFTINKGVS